MKMHPLRTLCCVYLFAGAVGPPSDQDKVICAPLNAVLELLPDTVTEVITDILWKFNNNKLAEWNKVWGPKVDYYPLERVGIKLIRETGKLIISTVTEQDNGTFSVEINHRVQTNKTYTVEVKKYCRNVPDHHRFGEGDTAQTQHKTQIVVTAGQAVVMEVPPAPVEWVVGWLVGSIVFFLLVVVVVVILYRGRKRSEAGVALEGRKRSEAGVALEAAQTTGVTCSYRSASTESNK